MRASHGTVVARRLHRTNPVLLALGLSTVGGVTVFVGWAGFGVWPLELVCLVPFWAALELVAGRSYKTVLGVAWLYGVIAVAGGYHWMLEFTQAFSGFGTFPVVVIFSAFCLWLGLQYGVQGVLYSVIRARGWSVPMAALPTFILTEWLFPKLFPVYLSNTLLREPLLVQTADLGGPLLVSVSVGVVNVAVFEAFRWWRGLRNAPVRLLSMSFAFVAFTLIYGAVQIRRYDARVEGAPRLEVGLAQVNMGVFEKHEQMLEAHRRYLEQSFALEAEGELDLLIWPESAYNFPRFGRSLPIQAKEVRGDLNSPLLFGGLSVTWQKGYRQLFNSVFMMDREGIIGERYDKTQLAMFGEYLPFGDRFPRLYMLSPNSGMFAPGEHLAPFLLGPWRVSTPVCYEAILPALVRNMVVEGDPHVLINLTNDAWFGDSQGPWIHLRLAQFRAIEHRRFLVRATNSGVSAVIDPVGRIVAATRIQQRENLRATVHPMEGRTIYARLGDWPGWMSLLLTLLGVVGHRRQRTERR